MPIFINLDTEEVVYSQHIISSNGNKICNSELGELWTWDRTLKDVWKISATRVSSMGRLKGNRGMALLHADNADRLYYTES